MTKQLSGLAVRSWLWLDKPYIASSQRVFRQFPHLNSFAVTVRSCIRVRCWRDGAATPCPSEHGFNQAYPGVLGAYLANHTLWVHCTEGQHAIGISPVSRDMPSTLALVELFTGTPVFNKAYGDGQPVCYWVTLTD